MKGKNETELSLKWESPTIILGRNRPKMRKNALKELKWHVFLRNHDCIVLFWQVEIPIFEFG